MKLNISFGNWDFGNFGNFEIFRLCQTIILKQEKICLTLDSNLDYVLVAQSVTNYSYKVDNPGSNPDWGKIYLLQLYSGRVEEIHKGETYCQFRIRISSYIDNFCMYI